MQPNNHSVLYFAFGQEHKSSLIAEFCREHQYQHVKNPIIEAFQDKSNKNMIIQGSLQLFYALQLVRPQLQVIFVGTKFSEDENQIRNQYRKIGQCCQVQEFNYQKFRKSMYPNLVFFYGPNKFQNTEAANAFGAMISYYSLPLPESANYFIKSLSKTSNYTISGLFTSQQQLIILQQYFNIKIIHFHYNRVDIQGKHQYFDKQYQLVSFLTNKPYYVKVKCPATPQQIMETVGNKVCPQLIYLTYDTQQKRQYVDGYIQVQNQNTVLLSIQEIKKINKRKGFRFPQDNAQKFHLLKKVLYKNFNIKTAILFDYPSQLEDVLYIEKLSRKFKNHINLVDHNNMSSSNSLTTQMYFLQTQRSIRPQISTPLQSYLQCTQKYYIVNGVAGAGKTTAAKFIANNFGLKLIQYQTYFASIKEKLLAPEDGEQVPLRKIFNHFKNLIRENQQFIQIIDGLPFEQKDLEEWTRVVGKPSVINVTVQDTQSIKRTRKKNQADVNAQITEQDLNKVRQNSLKSQKRIQKFSSLGCVIENLDFGFPLIKCEKSMNLLFKKNIYLIQDHEGLTFMNIALKNNIAFINLHQVKLRDSLEKIRIIQSKDIMLCYYKQNDQKLISEDLYFIQTHIGQVRYLGIWKQQQTQIKEQQIVLQKPQPIEKPKVQGAQGQDKPAEQAIPDKNKNFDIFSHSWTKPTTHKNLSQWFLKQKKQISEIKIQKQALFERWQQITKILKQSDNSHIYQTFQE